MTKKTLELLTTELENTRLILENMFQVTAMKLGTEVKYTRLYERLETMGYRPTPDQKREYQEMLKRRSRNNGTVTKGWYNKSNEEEKEV